MKRDNTFHLNYESRVGKMANNMLHINVYIYIILYILKSKKSTTKKNKKKEKNLKSEEKMKILDPEKFKAQNKAAKKKCQEK